MSPYASLPTIYDFAAIYPWNLIFSQKEAYFWTVSIVFSVYKQNLRRNNLKIRIAMNAKTSVFVICVETIIYSLVYKLHDCTFKGKTYFCSIIKILTKLSQMKFRGSHQRFSIKISVLKNCSIFTGKHLCWTIFLIKLQARRSQLFWEETPTQVFSCEYCKILKKTFLTEHLRTTASL